jgi:hypothetical protein
MATEKFFGWVPTVAGALSFSAFGETSHKPRAISANRADRRTRYLVCYRGRDCSDILLPFRSVVGPWFLNLSGKLWFVCVAKATTSEEGLQEDFQGRVLIFHDRQIWRSNVEVNVRDAQSFLRSYRYSNQPNIENHFEQRFVDLCDQLPALSAFNAKFKVSRTGFTELVLEDPMELHPSAPKLPDTQPSRDHVRHILAAQLFFFIRDIGHRHQHHDPYTDTIADLWPDQPGDPFNWKLRTLFSLYRKVIAYKRLKSADAFTASLGVAAYADTFRKLVEDAATAKQKERLPPFYVENVRKSIQAVDYEMSRKREISLAATAVTRELILTGLALMIAIVGVFQIVETKLKAEPATILYFLAQYLITSPILTLSIGAGFIWGARLLIQNPAQSRWVRWLVRLVQTFDLRFSIFIFTALAFLTLVTLIQIVRF